MAHPSQPKRWDEKVRLRAYYLWESEGRPLGRNDEFWDRAHREIIAESEPAPDPVAKPAGVTAPAS